MGEEGREPIYKQAPVCTRLKGVPVDLLVPAHGGQGFARPRSPSRPTAAAVGAAPYAGSRASAIDPDLGGPNVGCGFFGS